ncbi:MAG: DUF4114 domain-containing protein [Deltaproteobacteria bacterium]|nr:DUF4114 domain-containing protein [Deltaproteobacteria bacterium]
MKTWSTIASFLFVGALSLSASAITQPDGTPIPSKPGCNSGQPTGLASVFACECNEPNVCNIGVPCPSDQSLPCDDGKHGTCETTMWHSWNDNTCIPSNISGLDPSADAMVTPETFQPTCPLTFTVVSRGTAIFKDIFGWYNVTGAKPDVTDLHVMLDCNTVAGNSVPFDIQNDPAYKGGQVGFFLATPESAAGKTCSNGDCCATIARITAGEGHVFYSERAFNPDAKTNDAGSQIHLLIYDSKITPHKFYFAWEDLFGGGSGDFTDIVTSVMGVECPGGGLSCDVPNQIGMCKGGVTQCKGGAIECIQVIQSATEVCDGVDNDCDGTIDNNATCPTDMFCHNGRCVGNCTMGEFPCKEALTVCDKPTGLCVPADCVGKNCPADKVCRGGQCTSPCEGVVCPYGQICLNDACIDLCEGVTCDAPKTCRSGICFEGCGQCNGAACESSLKCDTTTGQCMDPSCVPACGAGTHCVAGACKDNCEGAQCPGGKACVDGKCEQGGVVQDSGAPDSPIVVTDSGTAGSGGTIITPDASAPDGAAGDSGPHGTTYDPNAPKSDSGCGCRAGASSDHGAWLVALLGIGLLVKRRGRRG